MNQEYRSFKEVMEAQHPELIVPRIFYVTYFPQDEDGASRIVPSDGDDALTHEDWKFMRDHIDVFYQETTPAQLASYKEIREKLREKAREMVRERNLRADVPPSRKIAPGYVYLLKGDVGQYKIGKSRDVALRLKTFGLTLPFPVELLHSIPADDYTAAEKYLHLRFADKRGRGEWFTLDQCDVDWICAQNTLSI